MTPRRAARLRCAFEEIFFVPQTDLDPDRTCRVGWRRVPELVCQLEDERLLRPEAHEVPGQRVVPCRGVGHTPSLPRPGRRTGLR